MFASVICHNGSQDSQEGTGPNVPNIEDRCSGRWRCGKVCNNHTIYSGKFACKAIYIIYHRVHPKIYFLPVQVPYLKCCEVPKYQLRCYSGAHTQFPSPGISHYCGGPTVEPLWVVTRCRFNSCTPCYSVSMIQIYNLLRKRTT